MELRATEFEKNAAPIGRILSTIWSPGKLIAGKATRTAVARRAARKGLVAATQSARALRGAATEGVEYAAQNVARAKGRVGRLAKPGLIERVSKGRWGTASRTQKLKSARSQLGAATRAQKEALTAQRSLRAQSGAQLRQARQTYQQQISALGPGSSGAGRRRLAQGVNLAARGTLLGAAGISAASLYNRRPQLQHRGYY